MIPQRHSYDCMICALAMYFEVSYEEVSDYFQPEDGVPCNEAAKYMWSLGADIDWYQELLPNKKAIVVVKSKNYPGKWHAIYFDGTLYHDPAHGDEKYKSEKEVLNGLIGYLGHG